MVEKTAKTPAKKTTAKTVDKPVVAKKPAVKKAAPAKAVTAKTASVAAAKKPAVKATAAKKPPIKEMSKDISIEIIVSDEQRYRMVSEAAYYRAESNNFKSDPLCDWMEAERDIEILLNTRR